jgi:glycosyltransferase involved in cell wall biosynthesis
MKIVVANKYYFYTGGPERYMTAVTHLLESKGHTVIPFAMKLAQNEPTPYADYFVSPPAGADQYKLEQFNLSLWQKAKLVGRAIYSWEARRKLERLIQDERVDLVYLLNICNYLSPSLIDAAKAQGIPVMMRLSDYNFVCAAYRFLRDGKVCTECQDKQSFWPALRYRCADGSLAQTAGRLIPMQLHRLINILGKVDGFVAPSVNMAEALVAFGCAAERVHTVPSFVDTGQFRPAAVPSRDYVLYAGRLDPDKGVHILLDAWARLGENAPPLRLAGTGTAVADLKAQARRLNLEEKALFLGQLTLDDLLPILQNAAFAVAPSLWPDNSPMSVYESLACGLPVIGSDIGGVKGQVAHGQNGFLFPPGDSGALATLARQLWQNPTLMIEMSERARETAVTQFSPEAHWRRLNEIMAQIRGKL